MKRTQEQIDKWIQNRQSPQNDIIARLPETVKPYAYNVGAWIWLDFFDGKPDKATRNIIKDLGFSWNTKRRVWQHPCEVFRKRAPYDPRMKYGIEPVETSIEEDNNLF